MSLFHFIQKIRASNHQTKMKWLIIFSSISMVFVILIWIAALNVITNDIANPVIAKPDDPSLPSLSEKFSRAIDEIKTRTTNAFSNVKTQLKGQPVELKQLTPQ